MTLPDPIPRLAAERRSSSRWNRFRRGAAKYVAGLLLLTASSVTAAVFTVITNGVRLPARVGAVEIRQKNQADTLGMIAHQLSDTLIPLVVWQAMRACGRLSQDEMSDNADKCGMAAHRSGAVFSAPFQFRPDRRQP